MPIIECDLVGNPLESRGFSSNWALQVLLVKSFCVF